PRVVFFGIPSDYGTAFLLHLIERRANLVAAVCSARWQRTHPKPDLIARIAGHLGRPVEVTADANAQAFVRCLKAYEPEVVVMASFDQILKAETLAVPKRGWLNIHPSLLPRHRGPEPIYWTIANGDRKGGISVHLTVPRIDAGPILAQRRGVAGRYGQPAARRDPGGRPGRGGGASLAAGRAHPRRAPAGQAAIPLGSSVMIPLQLETGRTREGRPYNGRTWLRK